MNSKEGRTVVITGGTGGIGFQSALSFDTNSREQKLHTTAYDSQVQDRILAVIEAFEGPSTPQP